MELAEPPRLQARRIAHDDECAREPLPYGQRATAFGNGSGRDEIGRVAERIISGNRLQPCGGIETATKELRELMVRETPWFEVETAQALGDPARALLEIARRRVQLVRIAGPYRERERGVEEPLRALRESVAKLERQAIQVCGGRTRRAACSGAARVPAATGALRCHRLEPAATRRRIVRTREMTINSALGLWREVLALHRARRYAEALATVERHRHMLSDPLDYDWIVMCICAQLGDTVRAYGAFSNAISGGGWFGDIMLRDSDLDPIRSDSLFIELAETSRARERSAQTDARPELEVRVPSTPRPAAGYPSVFALHGNSSNAHSTAETWSAANRSGWLLVCPQSAQVGRRGAYFVWDDSDRAVPTLRAQYETVANQYMLDPLRAVWGGFSLGAYQAALMIFAGSIPARGLALINPGGVGRLAALVDKAREREDRALRIYVLLGLEHPSAQLDGVRAFVSAVRQLGYACILDERDGLSHEYPADFDATLSTALQFVTGAS